MWDMFQKKFGELLIKNNFGEKLEKKYFPLLPDVVLSVPYSDIPYLFRWWIIPRNKYFNIYLHYFLRGDYDEVLHDHPWYNLSIVLFGRYFEEFTGKNFKTRRAGSITFRKPTTPHRIHLGDGETCWSLFITGPVIRQWGFHTPEGWMYWKTFIEKRDSGKLTASQ